MRARSLAAAVALALLPVAVPVPIAGTGTAVAATKPNIVFYNLDDLRDAVPGNIDPMTFMPKTRQWMSAGRRFPQHFVTEPSCCPSRSSLMTGRMAHNNGVRLQSQGPAFDAAHSMACYLRGAGYSTYSLGVRGREYITAALGLGKPFLLYETPQAPHWVDVTNPDGTTTQRTVPEAKYATAPVPTCSAPV